MSSYPRPQDVAAIYNNTNYNQGNNTITQGDADDRYLKLTGGSLSGLLSAVVGVSTSQLNVLTGDISLPNGSDVKNANNDRIDFNLNNLDFKIAGASAMNLTSSILTGPILRVLNGTVTAPSYSFTGDIDTGMYDITADTLGFATGGIERLRINTTALISTNDISVSKTLAFLSTTSSDNTFGVSTGGLRINTQPARCSGITWLYTGDSTRGAYIGTRHNNGSNIVGLTIQASTTAFTNPGNSAGTNEILRMNFDGGEMLLKAGTVLLPIYSFIGDTNTGFYNIADNNIGVACGGSLVMDINNTRTYIPTALTLLTTGGTQSLLNYYEENSATYNLGAQSGGNFATPTQTVTIRIIRIGKLVSISTSAVSGTVTTGKFQAFLGAIPARFCPLANIQNSIPIMNNGVFTTGFFSVIASGIIEIYPTPSSTNFTDGVSFSFPAFSMNYTCA